MKLNKDNLLNWQSVKICTGVLFISVGIICNVWTIGKYFTLKGVIDDLLTRWIIWIFDFACIGFGLFLLLFSNRINKTFIQNFILSVISVVVCVSMIEIGYFFYKLNKSDQYFIWLPHTYNVFKPLSQTLPGIKGMSHFTINSKGIRGRDFSEENEYRILSIGGSTTECLYLDDSEAFPALLEKYLNEMTTLKVWVGNVGRSGLNTIDHILAMKYLFNGLPRIDMIILLIGANDLMISLHPWYTPPFLRALDNEKWQKRRAFLVSPESFSFRSLFVFKLFQKLSYRFAKVLPSWQDEAGKWYEDRRRKRLDSEKINTIPDLSLPLKQYQININKIINIAREKSIRLLFLTQPSMWRKDLSARENNLLWAGAVGSPFDNNVTKYYSAQPLSIMMKKYNNILLENTSKFGVECIDLASILPKDTTVFYDDFHFNEGGANKIARIIADYLIHTKPFNKRSAIMKPEVNCISYGR